MADDGRLFLCERCRVQVVVCRRCDRGQIYCGRSCSSKARSASTAAAGRRYQGSRRGRFAHAARARRYRAHAKIVTHQGSASTPTADLLPGMTTASRAESVPVSATEPRCHRCGAPCAPALRQSWLRRHRWPRMPSVKPDDDSS
jgi:hypothetical protein